MRRLLKVPMCNWLLRHTRSRQQLAMLRFGRELHLKSYLLLCLGVWYVWVLHRERFPSVVTYLVFE